MNLVGGLTLVTIAFTNLLCAQLGVTKPVIALPNPASVSATPAPQQGPAPSAPVPVKPITTLPSYVLGPEDVILVSVWKEPNLTGSLVIRPDGVISLPLVGDMRAAGLTPMMLGNSIAQQLKNFIADPLVTVTLTAVNSKHIFMLGEIAHIGPLTLTPEMNILQAIATAGGLTPFANAKHIYILRESGGKQQKIPFDYKKAVKQGDLQGVSLMPNDTIYIPQ